MTTRALVVLGGILVAAALVVGSLSTSLGQRPSGTAGWGPGGMMGGSGGMMGGRGMMGGSGGMMGGSGPGGMMGGSGMMGGRGMMGGGFGGSAPAAAKPAASGTPAGAGLAAPAGAEVAASEFKFEPNTLSIRAGETTFVVKNAGAIAHNFVIEGQGGQSIARIPNIAVGATEQVTATLAPGTYTIVCTLPGHRAAGMVGTLTVVG